MKILYLIVQDTNVIGKVWMHDHFGLVVVFDYKEIALDEEIEIHSLEKDSETKEGEIKQMVLACTPVFTGIGRT